MFSRNNMKNIYGWGRYPKVRAKELFIHSESELLEILKKRNFFIARGNGRSYGDSAINKELTLNMTKFNKFIHWDESSGELIAQSGVLLSDIIDIFLAKGWFPFVTPGTKFVTLGGAIASDVHGKNHHIAGSFGKYVNWIDLINNNNEIVRCSLSENKELFNWTIGGMGLTGIILRASINLRKIESGWIEQRNIVNSNLSETLSSFYKYKKSDYLVAWIDCLSSGKSLGRSILMVGEHCRNIKFKNKSKLYPKRKKQKISLFFDFPSFLLNNKSVSLFNNLYFNINKNKNLQFVDWDKYFYPLDSIGSWNKLYGKKGFFQFQCLLSEDISLKGYEIILKKIQNKSSGAFLAVLKYFGEGNTNLSFPKKGFALALDFKATKKNIELGKELNNIVNDLGGSIYLAKDALLNKKQFSLQFNKENKKEFLEFRNPYAKSEQSHRINL